MGNIRQDLGEIGEDRLLGVVYSIGLPKMRRRGQDVAPKR